MRHLLGIEGVSKQEIVGLLDAAEEYYVQDSGRNAAHRETLRGITILNVFFEASTRTRSSFQLAAKRLGADVVNINATTSSVVKGETLLDTARNLEVMRADVLVLRHHASGAPHFLAPRTRAHVINAGDGTHEHPTQALLDAFTIRRRLGSIEGRVVAICGDVLHSRVARSNALLLGKLGAQVRLCGPRTMLPLHAETLGETASVGWKFDEAVAGADVIMMLRIQNERLAGAMMATTREYARTFGLNAARLALAKPTAIVMHPGPINRGVEIDPLIADGPQSVILDQVEAGVAVRAAVLAHVVAAA